MLQYLYTSRYNHDGAAEMGVAPLVFDVYLHAIADKYNLSDLASLVEHNFSVRAKEEWKDKSFAEAISEIYTTAADRKGELSSITLNVATEKAWFLYEEDYGAEFRRVATSVPGFGADLAARLAKRVGTGAVRGELRFKCPSGGICSRTFVTKQMYSDCMYYCVTCGKRYVDSVWAEHVVKDE